MTTELVLVRHGHAVRVKGDYVNAPLTELGRTQAELTGMRFCTGELALDGFYSSPLRRTKETSAIVGSKMGKIPAIQKGVQELEGFEVPMLIASEFLAHLGWFGKYLYENSGKPIHWPIVGRVSKVVSDLLKKHEGERFAIVTHSGVISSVLAWYFPHQRRRWWTYTVDNCSLTLLRVEGTAAQLVFVNDTKHLSDELTTKQPPAATVEIAKKTEDKVEDIVLQKKPSEKDALLK
jgi:broad specificity phosphatase PhoE